MNTHQAHHGPPMPGAPLSLWPHRLNRYARLQAGLERLEDLRAEMIARLDEPEGDPDLEDGGDAELGADREPSLCGVTAGPGGDTWGPYIDLERLAEAETLLG